MTLAEKNFRAHLGLSEIDAEQSAENKRRYTAGVMKTKVTWLVKGETSIKIRERLCTGRPQTIEAVFDAIGEVGFDSLAISVLTKKEDRA